MGCGSSARGRARKKVCAANEVTVYDAAVEAQEVQAVRKSREREDDEARWLRMLIEKEKAEKEWLMSRYEKAEKELQARNEECDRLRLALAQPQGGATLGATSPMPADSKTLPAKQGLAAMHPPASMPTPPLSPNPTETNPSSNPISPVPLKERRGLRLSVQTNSRIGSSATKVSQQPVDDVANGQSGKVLEAQPPTQALPESESKTQRPSRAQDFLASLNKAPGELVEPMTAKARIGSQSAWAGQEEPMSPLLRRRRESNPDENRLSKRKSAERFQTSPGDLGGALSITTPKIFKMDDVPQTPKRIPATPATAKRRQDSIWNTIIEDYKEDETSPLSK